MIRALAVILWANILAFGGQAQTPELLIQTLLEAARNGDVEAFLSGLTAESRKTASDSFANEAALRQARDEFKKALDERFGGGATIIEDPLIDLRTVIGRLAAAEVVGRQNKPDGSVELKVKTSIRAQGGETVSRDETLVMRQEGGRWRLLLGFAPPGTIAAERKTAAERITREVREGKYKDRIEAMIALDNAWTRREGSAK